MIRRFVTWLSKRYGVCWEWQAQGYDWGFRVARAHPEMPYEERFVPYVEESCCG